MTAIIEDISATKKRLKIEIPAEIIEKEYIAGLDNVRQRARIPGFRQGKAPINLIEQRFGGDIRSDIVDRLVPDYYSKALKEANLVPVTMPTFENKIDLKRNAPLSLALTVEVRPNIADLKYAGLKIDETPVSIEDKEVEDALRGLQEERALFDAVDREIKNDDVIIIDYVKYDASGEKELSSAKDQVMNLGNNLAPQGILEALLGRKKGDVSEVRLPDFEAGADSEGPGKEADNSKGSLLKITVKEVKEKKLPQIDDEFAKDFGQETMEAFREKIRESILKAKKDKASGASKDRLIEMMVAEHDFDVPESLFEKELEKLVVNERHARTKGTAPAAGEEQSQSASSEDDGLAEELKPKAKDNVKAAMILDVIAEKENITATEDELKKRVAALAGHFKTTPESIMNFFITKDGSLDGLHRSIRDEKVLDFVLSKAEMVKGA